MPKHFQGENLPSEIIRLLRDERFRQGLSMNAVAQRAGLSQSSVSLLESERRKPTLETLLRLCDALSVDLWKVVKNATERSDQRAHTGDQA